MLYIKHLSSFTIYLFVSLYFSVSIILHSQVQHTIIVLAQKLSFIISFPQTNSLDLKHTHLHSLLQASLQMPDRQPGKWSSYQPLQSYYSFHSTLQASTSPSNSTAQESSPSTSIKTFSNDLTTTMTDRALAQHLQEMSLNSITNPSATTLPSPNPIIKAPHPPSPVSSSSSVEIAIWSIADPIVRSKIHHLYRLCISNFNTTPGAGSQFLNRINATVDDYRIIRNVIISWFDLIIDEVQKIYWIEVSREQVWDVLGSMGELNGACGSYKIFLELGTDSDGLEALMVGLRM
jgi:hypothetical protein